STFCRKRLDAMRSRAVGASGIACAGTAVTASRTRMSRGRAPAAPAAGPGSSPGAGARGRRGRAGARAARGLGCGRQVAPSGRARRAITLHLGQGRPAPALVDGAPVDTSMGFPPLEALVTGTRAGDLDPGVIVHLMQLGYGARELEDALNRRSGLLGLSGS